MGVGSCEVGSWGVAKLGGFGRLLGGLMGEIAMAQANSLCYKETQIFGFYYNGRNPLNPPYQGDFENCQCAIVFLSSEKRLASYSSICYTI